ncbi:hypothetical protein HEK616_83310 (plasmid) [Streptomyces nigrescens]|uniref:Secreted protein n=1 Tax=Streptomyces nigrescens TaxID=1920 RepID=A0ABM8A800_STRNI|nr:hypothetical protein HEK616_83310 [Streptomyces nigrescens]
MLQVLMSVLAMAGSAKGEVPMPSSNVAGVQVHGDVVRRGPKLTQQVQGRGQQRGVVWAGSNSGRGGNRAAHWSHNGSVSHDGSAGTDLLGDHERRNSMITEPVPASSATPPTAYPRDFLVS